MNSNFELIRSDVGIRNRHHQGTHSTTKLADPALLRHATWASTNIYTEEHRSLANRMYAPIETNGRNTKTCLDYPAWNTVSNSDLGENDASPTYLRGVKQISGRPILIPKLRL